MEVKEINETIRSRDQLVRKIAGWLDELPVIKFGDPQEDNPDFPYEKELEDNIFCFYLDEYSRDFETESTRITAADIFINFEKQVWWLECEHFAFGVEHKIDKKTMQNVISAIYGLEC